MSEQIERLKENLMRISRMPQSDVLFLKSIPLDSLVFLGWSSGTWDGPSTSYDFVSSGIYRIHRNYTPAPEKPVFEGYELCEVFVDSMGMFKYYAANGTEHYIDCAPVYGCYGYVFKEDTSRRFNSPIMFVNERGHFNTECLNGYKPATLGWVAFKEEQK